MSSPNHRRKACRLRSWIALALSLAAAGAGAREPVDPQADASAQPVSQAVKALDGPAEAVGGTERPHALTAKPRIGRIFFSPAERRNRHDGGLAATPAAPTSGARGSGSIAPRKHQVVNGALSSSSRGRAVWVDGVAIDNSDRDKSAWTDRNGNVWLMNGSQGTRLIRPGQSIDRNGVIEDLLPPGAVTGH
jgi:hypothetical protein